MKNIIYICVYFFYASWVFGQEGLVVVNDKMLIQVNKNQAVRTTSLESFQKLFKDQKELYQNARLKVTEIMAVHEHIYQQLYNVNSLFNQGKQMKYIYQYIGKIGENGGRLMSYTVRYPKYAVWITKYYENLFGQMVGLKTEIEQVLKKPRRDILMDAHDRDAIIERIYGKLRHINISMLHIINLIEYSASRPYIYSIPNIGNFVQTDRLIVNDIISRFNRLGY